MTKVILFGTLRRDTMVLGQFDDTVEGFSAEDEARKAVEQGRAQTAFTVEATAFFSAADVNWANPDQHHVGGRTPVSSTPALNPHHGEGEALDESDAAPEVTIRGNIEADAEDSPKGVNTGTDPEGKPTDPATLGKVEGAKPADSTPAKK